MGLTEFGHFALISAFVLSLIQSLVPLVGTVRYNMQLMLVILEAARNQRRCCLRDCFWRVGHVIYPV